MNLRPVEPDDLPWIRDMRNSAEVYGHVRERRFLSMGDQEAWYRQLVEDRGRTMLYYVLGDRALDSYQSRPLQPYGVVGLTRIDWLNRSAEVACMVSPVSEETRAVAIIVEHGRQVLGLHRFYTECLTERREKVFWGAGFDQEGILKGAYWRDGKWVDATYWAYVTSGG